MNELSIQNEGNDFQARLVVDGDNDLAIEVSCLKTTGVPLVEIVKLADIAPENFKYINFLSVCLLLPGRETLGEYLKKPVMSRI